MSYDHCNIIGQTGEAAVAAQLAAAGFHVYAPIFCKPESDIIAEMNGKLIRLQVKTLAGEAPVLRFATATNTNGGYIGVVDWLAFHSLHYGITAFLKPEEVGAKPTLRYNNSDITDRPGQRRRYARDYPIDRVIKEITE